MSTISWVLGFSVIFFLCTLYSYVYPISSTENARTIYSQFLNVQLLPFTFGADYLSYNLKECI